MEPKNGGLEDDFPFQTGDFRVPWNMEDDLCLKCQITAIVFQRFLFATFGPKIIETFETTTGSLWPWPKINGFGWGYFTPFITGFWAQIVQ